MRSVHKHFFSRGRRRCVLLIGNEKEAAASVSTVKRLRKAVKAFELRKNDLGPFLATNEFAIVFIKKKKKMCSGALPKWIQTVWDSKWSTWKYPKGCIEQNPAATRCIAEIWNIHDTERQRCQSKHIKSRTESDWRAKKWAGSIKGSAPTVRTGCQHLISKSQVLFCFFFNSRRVAVRICSVIASNDGRVKIKGSDSRLPKWSTLTALPAAVIRPGNNCTPSSCPLKTKEGH